MQTAKNTILIVLLTASGVTATSQTFFKPLQEYADEVSKEFNLIEKDRKQALDFMADYIYEDWIKDKKTNVLFICTHNSRRSHMASLWFQAAAYYKGLTNIQTYSGGTEATALNRRAAAALSRAGFSYSISDSSTMNMVYSFRFGERYPAKHLFSKVFSHESIPQKDFIAIMVCSDADKSCPIVPGADQRFSLPYNDPRYSDNTASETAEYDKACRLIAREMFYLVNKVKQKTVIYQESKKG
jgi:arsenate reductase (thioredoxin)